MVSPLARTVGIVHPRLPVAVTYRSLINRLAQRMHPPTGQAIFPLLEPIMLVFPRLITRAALVAVVLFAGTALGISQGIVTGSISGTVQDPSGAIVAGAAVIGTELTTNSAFKTTTSSAGTFQLPGLPVGVYTVTVEAAGFTPL